MTAPAQTGTILDFYGAKADLGPPFKEGRPSTHPLGVLYQAPWETAGDGFNEHSRRCARALALTGCPVLLRSFLPRVGVGFGEDAAIEQQMAPLAGASIARASVHVCQAVLRGRTMLQNLVPSTHRFLEPEELEASHRTKVVYSVWERDRISAEDAGLLNKVAQVWTACRANAAMLARSGVDEAKIRVVPIPFFPDDPMLALAGRTRTPGPVRFYHIGKWEPRKAQDKLILAFLRAFKPTEAILMLKTSEKGPKVDDYPETPMRAIHAALADDAVKKNEWTVTNVGRGVIVIARQLPPKQIVELHRMGDVYVTLSRGEGFEMSGFDSKLAGNVMVYTPSGGPQDFASACDQRVEPSGSIPCSPFYRWDADARYLDYDIDEAVRAMQRSLTYATLTHGPAAARIQEDLAPFSAARVGQKMLGYLREVVGVEGRVY